MSELWRTLVEELAADPASRRRLTTEVTDAIHAELGELATDSELTEATRESVEDNIALFAAVVSGGEDPADAQPRAAATAFVRMLVQRGVGADALAEAYRVAHGVFWRAFVAELHGRLDGAELARALEESSQVMFAFIDALSQRVRRLHAEERDRWVRSPAAVRAEVVRTLVDGLPVDQADAERRLGYTLARTHTAFVVWGPPGTGARTLEAAAEAIAAAAGAAPLLHPLGRAVAAWVARPKLAGAVPPDGVRVAVGEPAPGPAGFRRSHLEALHARRLALLLGAQAAPVTRYADVAVPALASADLEAARHLVAGELGAVAGDPVLAATLRAHLEGGSSVRGTARALAVHENTVANRLARAETAMGRPVHGRVGAVLLALALLPVVGD